MISAPPTDRPPRGEGLPPRPTARFVCGVILVFPILLAGCAALRRLPGTATHQAEAGVTVYTNDDALTVWSPWARVAVPITDALTVNGGWTADAISSATVDVISQATRPYDELRNEARAGLGYRALGARGGLSWYGSSEPDTVSHTAVVAGEVDLLERNLTLGLGYGLTANHFGQAAAPRELWSWRTLHQVDATIAQVLGPSTVGSIGYTLQELSGDLASPYHRVPLFPGSADAWDRKQAQWVDERHPDTRWRHALALKGRHALSDRLFLRAGYRGYLDSWGMRASSGELGLAWELGFGSLELSDRLHWQSRASFHRSTYTVNRAYVTGDRRLGEMTTHMTSVALRPRVGEVELVLRSELHWTRYADGQRLLGDELAPIPDVWALVGQVGVAWER